MHYNVQPQWLKLPSSQEQGKVLAFAQSSLVPVPQVDQAAKLEQRVPRAAVAELLWSQKAELESCQDRQLSLSIIRRDAEEVLLAPLAHAVHAKEWASLRHWGQEELEPGKNVCSRSELYIHIYIYTIDNHVPLVHKFVVVYVL